MREPELPVRVRGAAGADDQAQADHRLLVMQHSDHLQPFGSAWISYGGNVMSRAGSERGGRSEGPSRPCALATLALTTTAASTMHMQFIGRPAPMASRSAPVGSLL